MADHQTQDEYGADGAVGNTGLVSKFANAFSGCFEGIRGQNSFYFHLPTAIGVVVLALVLEIELNRLLILLLCIGLVLVAEMINSSIERACRAITREYNDHVRAALDIASGAVLMASMFAATIGAIVFLTAILT